MITYNQRAFIGQAIESVLMQRTDFPVTLHIGDDCSTDGTQDILRARRDAHPDRIVLHLSDRRGGGRVARENNMRTIDACRGAEFIALLDGDDYWTDPAKLQRQVDFLEGNSGYSGTGHDARRLHENTGRFGTLVGDEAVHMIGRQAAGISDFDLEQDDLFRFMPQTSTLCFRSCALPPFPRWFRRVLGADVAIAMLLADSAPIRFDRRVMSVYRIHAASEIQRLVNSPDQAMAVWNHAHYRELLSAFPQASSGRNRAFAEVAAMKLRWQEGSFGAALRCGWAAARLHPRTLLGSVARALRRKSIGPVWLRRVLRRSIAYL